MVTYMLVSLKMISTAVKAYSNLLMVTTTKESFTMVNLMVKEN